MQAVEGSVPSRSGPLPLTHCVLDLSASAHPSPVAEFARPPARPPISNRCTAARLSPDRGAREAPVIQMPAPTPQPPAGSPFFPAPYRAVLAICSDLDETPDAETYFESMRFLNTTEDTPMGSGVGLEVGNSIYFNMAPGQFSYWNTTEANREKLRALIRSGHIDVLHSYGDLATKRAEAAQALEELEKYNCYLKVWVDHAVAPSNFGADIMQGHGDEPGHPAYHADLTLGYGIRYVWRGRVTSVIAQNQPFRLGHLASDLWSCNSNARGAAGYPAAVRRAGTVCRTAWLATLLKEVAKQILGRCGYRKYALHGPNRVLMPVRLRDGSPVQEFLRCNPHWGGVSCGDRGDRVDEVLTPGFLDRLVARQGICILYTHLGKLTSGPSGRRFPDKVVAAFRRLAHYYREGKILVATTGRALELAASLSPNVVPRASVTNWTRLTLPEV